MSSPNGDVFWIPYQRVVLPLKLGPQQTRRPRRHGTDEG